MTTDVSVRVGLTACALLLTSCSGGGGSAPQAPYVAPTATVAAPAGSVPVTFTMHWPSAAQAAKARSPQYVPATAMSVGVSVNGGTAQYLNNPGTTLTIAANPGVDTFAFQTYDETNGQGNVLSHASITQTVVSGTANAVSAVLNGVIASLSTSLAQPTANAGTATTMAVNVSALDADGNVIVGPADYDRPIKLAIDDPEKSGALALSTTLLQAPGTNVTLTYNGATLGHADVAASANGVATAIGPLDPTPTAYGFPVKNGIQSLATGPNATIVLADPKSVNIIDATGAIRTFTDPTANAFVYDAILGSDGRIYFTEVQPGHVASIAQDFSGYHEYPVETTGDDPRQLVDRGDGRIYYQTSNTNANRQYVLGSVPLDGKPGGPAAYVVSNPPFGGDTTSFAVGPDNRLYFSAGSGGTATIETLDPSTGSDTAVVTSPDLVSSFVFAGDGNLWAALPSSEAIASYKSGTLQKLATYPTKTPSASPAAITLAHDGTLWYDEVGSGRVARITTSGTTTEYTLLPSSSNDSFGGEAATSTDGSLWFGDYNGTTVYRVVY